MSIFKYAAWFRAIGFAGFAYIAIVGFEPSKPAWLADWLNPILVLICFVSLAAVSHRPDATARTRAATIASYGKSAAVAMLGCLYIMIQLVSDAPVTLRLMGMSWATSTYVASRLLIIGGVFIGVIAVWVTLKQAHREAGSATIAESNPK